MGRRSKEHKKLVYAQISSKKSKRACQKWGMNYKESPYCLFEHDNYARTLYPCLRYVK